MKDPLRRTIRELQILGILFVAFLLAAGYAVSVLNRQQAALGIRVAVLLPALISLAAIVFQSHRRQAKLFELVENRRKDDDE